MLSSELAQKGVAVKVFQLFDSIKRTARSGGHRAVLSKVLLRLSRYANDYFGWTGKDFPLLWDDVVSSSEVKMADLGAERKHPESKSLHIGWVCLPPSAGSGGHTTLFRMIEAAERRGHKCTLYLYEKDSENIDRRVAVIRKNWPMIRANVRSARPRMTGEDVIVSSSWETAHVVASRSDSDAHRMYFIQDYEPFFYSKGPMWDLAEDTYRFGYSMIALGEMVDTCLRKFANVVPVGVVPFGCDTDVYSIAEDESQNRRGIVYYAKKSSDRRGYWLAKEALHLFHQEHPEQEIHVVGDKPTGWSIPVTCHGNLEPRKLNELYNGVLGGIALSFTNISLVAEEMLASGVLAVVNDSDMARQDLTTAGPMWAEATPHGISSALGAIIDMPASELVQRRKSIRVREGWAETGNLLVDLIEQEVARHSGIFREEGHGRIPNGAFRDYQVSEGTHE